MALFAIGDLHLSANKEKSMDIFPGWENYTGRIVENWRAAVGENDAVVLAGDTSWGMTLAEALDDFRLLDSLPGSKILLKGNHDYWWTSVGKMTRFLRENGVGSIEFLHNNAHSREGFALCGSRGWLFENGAPHDEKIINREAIRIEASLRAASKMPGEKLMFLHYPPVFAGQEQERFLDVMRRCGIRRCYYGHIHGAGRRQAITGYYKGIDMGLVSADYLRFKPVQII